MRLPAFLSVRGEEVKFLKLWGLLEVKGEKSKGRHMIEAHCNWGVGSGTTCQSGKEIRLLIGMDHQDEV